MKHNVILSWIIIATLMVVGCKPKYQRVISRELKQYVQTNFDNPNDLKEIVSISDSPDTINVANLGTIAVETFFMSVNIFDTITNRYAITDEMPGIKNYKGSYANKLLILSKTIDQYNIQREWMDIYDIGSTIVDNILSDIDNNEYHLYYSYAIKTRVKDSLGRVKLKTFYAIQRDSTDIFEIKDHNIQCDDMPRLYSDLAESTTRLYKVTEMCDSLMNKYRQLYKEVSILLLYQDYME